jgi:hypothetical protein
VLFRAVAANMAVGFRFSCPTDFSSGLDPEIGLCAEQITAPVVWRKLALFCPEVAAFARANLGSGQFEVTEWAHGFMQALTDEWARVLPEAVVAEAEIARMRGRIIGFFECGRE